MGTTSRGYPFPEPSSPVDVPGDIEALAEAANDDAAALAAGTALNNGAVTAAKLATDAVETAKIKDANVTEAKLATGAVTEAKIGTGAVTEAKIGASAVTSAKIADGTIVNADINASAAIARTKIEGTPPPSSLTITAGTGLTGGGDLSADRTLAAVAPWATMGLKPAATQYVAQPSGGVVTANFNAATLAAGSMIYLWAGALDRIGINVSTAATPGVVRLGIYSANATTGRPDALQLDAGTVDATTTGSKEITISHTVSASGWYWLVACPQDNTTAIWLGCVTSGGGLYQHTAGSLAGSLTATAGSTHGFQHNGSVTGALPATFAPLYSGVLSPRVSVRYSTVT